MTDLIAVIQKTRAQLLTAKSRQTRIALLHTLAKHQVLARAFNDAIRTYSELLEGYSDLVSSTAGDMDSRRLIQYTAILSNIAMLYRREGNPAEALRIYRKAIQMLEERMAKGENTGNVRLFASFRMHLFDILGNEAALYRQLEDFDGCFDVYEKMLYVIDRVIKSIKDADETLVSFDKNATEDFRVIALRAQYSLARLHKAIGQIYFQEGEKQGAIDHFKQSVTWYKSTFSSIEIGKERIYGVRRIEMAESLSNCATLHLQRHELDDALTLWTETLKLQRGEYEADHPSILATLNNLAVAYEMKGDDKKAISSHEQIFAIREQTLGKNNTDTGVSLVHIANNKLKTGDFDDAMEKYAEALSIFRNTHEHFHPKVAGVLYCMGCVHHRRGDFNDAIEVYEEVILIRKSTVGELDVTVADTYIALGETYRRLAKLDDAMSNYVKALTIFEKCGLSQYHPSVRFVGRKADVVRKKLGQSDEVFFGNYSFEDSQSTEIEQVHKLMAQDEGMQSTSDEYVTEEEVFKTPFGSQDIVNLIQDDSCRNVEEDRTIMVFIEKLRSYETSINGGAPDGNEIARTFVEVGNIFFERGKSDKSIRMYQEALLLQQNELEFALTLSKLADAYLKKGLYEQALESYREALDLYRNAELSEEHPNIIRTLDKIAETLDEEQRSF